MICLKNCRIRKCSEKKLRRTCNIVFMRLYYSYVFPSGTIAQSVRAGDS